MESAIVIDSQLNPPAIPVVKPPFLLLRLFPSLTDLAFLLPIIALFTLLDGTRTMLGDGDTGWHIRTGDWILQHGQVPHKDLFSFTMPDRDWFAWEWGWDVLFSIIHSHWSLSGVVLANVFVLGVVGILMYRLVRRRAGNDVIAVLLTALAVGGTSVHWLARPHLLSWVFILAFLHLIDRAEQGNGRLLWWSPLLTLFWVNLHGSFFIGIFFLLTYGVANTVQGLTFSGKNSSCFNEILLQRTYFLCALACLAASLFNPYAWHLHEHVVGYLSDAKQLDLVNEYASLSFHSPFALRFELFLVLGVCAVYRCLSAKQWAQAAMLLIWAHLALKSARNIPIFLFVATPSIAAFVCASLESIRQSAVSDWARRLGETAMSFGQDFQSLERIERLPIVPLTALAFLAAALGVLPAGRARLSDFDKRDFPVNAASVIAQYPDARVFTFDQWGDYLIYRCFPKKKVFVDGRSDFYGADFSKQWLGALRGKYDWNTELSRFSIDTVLLKADDALPSILKQSREWKPIFDDGLAIVFRKRSAPEWRDR